MNNISSGMELPISTGYGILVGWGIGAVVVQIIYHYNYSSAYIDNIYTRFYINSNWHAWGKIACTKIS